MMEKFGVETPDEKRCKDCGKLLEKGENVRCTECQTEQNQEK